MNPPVCLKPCFVNPHVSLEARFMTPPPVYLETICLFLNFSVFLETMFHEPPVYEETVLKNPLYI